MNAAETASLKTQLTNAETNGNPAEAARIRKLLGKKADEVVVPEPAPADVYARQDAPTPAPTSRLVDPPHDNPARDNPAGRNPRDDPKRA